MISCNSHSVGHSAEYRAACVQHYFGGFAVHRLLCLDDPSAECLSYRLMSETYAEDRNTSGECLYRFDAYSCICGITGSGRYNDRFKLAVFKIFLYLSDSDLIVSDCLYVGINRTYKLHEIICKAVVIIYHKDHINQPPIRALRLP